MRNCPISRLLTENVLHTMISRAHYYGLDVLRFGSALIVASYHLFFWSWAGIYASIDQTNHLFADAAQFPWAVGLTSFGWVGVPIFFVISGFVISNSAAFASPMEFLTGRMLRLYPAVWVCATATAIASYLIAGDRPQALFGPYLKSLLLVPRSPWIDGLYWTLAVEIAFYALVFIVLLLKRISLVHLAWALTLCSCVFNCFYLSVMLGIIQSSAFILFFTSHALVLGIPLLPYGCMFALGIWLWRSTTKGMTIAAQIGGGIALIASGFEVYAHAVQIASTVPAASGQSPCVPLVIFLLATVIVVISTRAANTLYFSARAGVILRYLGLISYPLYLIHNLAGAGISRVLITAGMNSTLAVLLTLFGLICLCWLFCWGLEPFLRKWLRLCLNHVEGTMLRPRPALAFLFEKRRYGVSS